MKNFCFKPSTFERLQKEATAITNGTIDSGIEDLQEIKNNYNIGLITENECYNQVLEFLIEGTENDGVEQIK